MGYGSIYIDIDNFPESWQGWIQLIFLSGTYSYILIQGCSLISEGSELLELTKYKDLVGPTILPVLGAVPDGAIVLFSGIGSDAQEQLETGIGALAGSTVMLLTVPWILSIMGGRVNLNKEGDELVGSYKQKKKLREPDTMSQMLFETGVDLDKGKDIVWTMGKWMIITSIPYFIIQGSAFENTEDDTSKIASGESVSALVSFIGSTFLFFAYLAWSYSDAMSEDADDGGIGPDVEADRMAHKRDKALKRGVSLTNVVRPLVDDLVPQKGSDYGSEESKGISKALMEDAKYESKRKELSKLLGPYFTKYSRGANALDKAELSSLFKGEFGEDKTQKELEEAFAEFDADNSGAIEMDEFVTGCAQYVVNSELTGKIPKEEKKSEEGGSDEDDEDEEEMPEDLVSLPYEQQQAIIMTRACKMLAIGTLLVLVFSDPLVDCIDLVGDWTGIPDFYLSFVFAPLVTNGSELLASYTFAKKKTSSSITCSLQQLFGAAIMNNTYCLLIFCGLIYFQKLYWAFSAETISILLVEWIMFYYAYQRVHRLFDALVVISLYPFCLVVVYVLENVFGWD